MGVRAVVLLAATLGLQVGQAQFGPFAGDGRKPQAKTQEELDLYLEVYTSSEPRETVAQAERFEAAHPDSRFLGLAFQHKMAALRDLGDYEGVLRAGTRALELVPGNLNTLITLATVIPNGVEGRPDREDLLARARNYASAVLNTLDTLVVPAEIPLEQWESRKSGLESEAHEALGHVAVKNGDLAEALRRSRPPWTATRGRRPASGTGLGGAYVLAGQPEKAIAPLRRAAESGEDTVRRLALDQLRRIEAAKSR